MFVDVVDVALRALKNPNLNAEVIRRAGLRPAGECLGLLQAGYGLASL